MCFKYYESQGPGSAESRVQLRCPLAAGRETRRGERQLPLIGFKRGSKGISWGLMGVDGI